MLSIHNSQLTDAVKTTGSSSPWHLIGPFRDWSKVEYEKKITKRFSFNPVFTLFFFFFFFDLIDCIEFLRLNYYNKMLFFNAWCQYALILAAISSSKGS